MVLKLDDFAERTVNTAQRVIKKIEVVKIIFISTKILFKVSAYFFKRFIVKISLKIQKVYLQLSQTVFEIANQTNAPLKKKPGYRKANNRFFFS
jgi:LytS/YehU family sensor histidine kinase